MNARETFLVLLCRRPRHGGAVPALASGLGPELACLLESGLFDCAVEDLLAWPGPRCLAPAVGEEAWGHQVTAGRATILPQPAGAQGASVLAVDANLRRAGARQVLFMRADVPTVDAAYLASAVAALNDGATVLGPTMDGGLALYGATHPWDGIERVSFGRSTAATRLAEQCRRAGHTMHVLEPTLSVSRFADLAVCRDALERDSRPARVRLQHVLELLTREQPAGQATLRQVVTANCGAAVTVAT
jgi:glycosyltransferase A (GT-A) superfamily protein (DUF2064 family)